MKDLFSEIWNSVRNNKLRTALTGFAVSWGIFLLICLLGAGNGIINAFQGSSDRFVTNSMNIFGGVTSLPANGYKEGRRIEMDKGDLQITQGREFQDNVDKLAPATNSITDNLVLGTRTMSTSLQGVTTEYKDIEKVIVQKGRFINQLDLKEQRKVMVVSTKHEDELGTDLIGKWVNMHGFSFRVIGVYQSDESDWRESAFIPYSTMKGIFYPGDEIGELYLTFNGVHNMKESDEFENKLARRLKTYHKADPEDPNAIWIWNRYSQNAQISMGQRIISIGMWILGLLTLVSGIVGVSNIMLISVKERTHEFGIRKAIGAKPRKILSLIIAESVSITAFFGYVGMGLGMLACEIMDKTLGQNTMDLGFDTIKMMDNPTVGLDVAFEATLLLIVAGTLAGLIPAWKAAKVKPIEALRAE
ncbi:MAG: ABC transporter permease [Bacteroidales bacterium]|nr:ABC transporter permease [Bacteroidales bacterium]